eukprot:14671933-Alexandrium_andersonii.AAC.1
MQVELIARLQIPLHLSHQLHALRGRTASLGPVADLLCCLNDQIQMKHDDAMSHSCEVRLWLCSCS